MNAESFYSQRYTGLFFQDDWRANSRLTLNFGLRWDYERPVEERYNRLTDRFDPTALNPISGAAQSAYAAILSNRGERFESRRATASAAYAGRLVSRFPASNSSLV